MIELNLFVKDQTTGQPVANAVVLAYGPAVPPQFNSRYTQGDGGANFYAGPVTTPEPYSFTVIAAGYLPWTTTDQPITFGSETLNLPVELVPSFKRPPVNLRDWRGAFVIPDALPGIPFGDGSRIWTPAFTCYQGDNAIWQDRMLELFNRNGWTHLPYNCAGSIYHNDYPDMSDDPARVRRDLIKIRRAGVVPVVCACDDQDGGNLVPWRSFSENADLVEIDFPMWEMNGPLGNATYNGDGTYSGRIVDCIQNVRAAAPKAETYLHFTAGHGSIGEPERGGWAFVKTLGVIGLLSQDDGYERNPVTGDPAGTAAGLQDTAERLATLGLLNVAFEQITYPTYLQWPGYDQVFQKAYGTYLVEHAPGIAGFCDGGK